MHKKIGIILNGATGRICSNQHLANSLIAIRTEGGLRIRDEIVFPELVLVGRNKEKLKRLAQDYDIENWTTALEVPLADPSYPIFFNAAATNTR